MPNLLFITTDQQRFDSLPCYGRPFVHAPNLERLAREGTVFERCYVTAPLCVPCRAAFMSGQWPSATGVLGNGHWLPEGTRTWAGDLAAAGVRTAAIGKMHFYPWDAKCGFGERIVAEDKRHMYLPDDHAKYLEAHGLKREHPCTLPDYFESLGAPVFPHAKRFHIDAFVGDRAAEWLAACGAEPFAAWVSFPGPHDPYDPPAEMAQMYKDAPIPAPIGGKEELARKPKAQGANGARQHDNAMYRADHTAFSPAQARRWREHYFANISLIDEGIGKMLQALEAAGTLEDTRIVFTSDHGDALGDHGMAFKSFFYESMAHVPLIVRGPGVAAGARCRSLISTLDLVPLFYRTCRQEPPAQLQGLDPEPLLREPDTTLRERVFSETSGRAMVFDGRWKFAQYESGEAELYDLEGDPNELTNRAGEPACAAEQSRLQRELTAHLLQNQKVRSRTLSVPSHPLRVAINREWSKALGGRPVAES